MPVCLVGRYAAYMLSLITAGGVIGSKLLRKCFSDVQITMIGGLSAVSANVYNAFIFNNVMVYIGMILFMQVEFEENSMP